MAITITRREQTSRRMSGRHVNQAVEAIRRDGFVVIENVVPHEPLDILREKMNEDSQVMIDLKKWGGAGHLKGHLQQAPPPFAPFVFPEIVANPFVIQVNTALLGGGISNGLYTGNTNCPGSQTQPLHRDGSVLWPGNEPAHPTASVVVNISPLDTTEENGAVELWPGTHLHTSPKKQFGRDMERAQRQASPPIRACAKKGSALIRDVRLWHRGVPNHSDHPRHMIAMVHIIHWLRYGSRLMFNAGCEDAFPDDCGLNHSVGFTDDSIDYLNLKQPGGERRSERGKRER